jgi:nucleoside-diphosphate-sugar epimerase
MKLTIFGATGATGTNLVQQALAAGHQVTAVVRDPARLAIPAHQRLRTITAPDVTDPAASARRSQTPTPYSRAWPRQVPARPRSARTVPAASSRPCRKPPPADSW